MSEVIKVPYLSQKGRSYYFRIRVPEPLVEAYGRREVTQALGRVSQPQAAIKARDSEDKLNHCSDPILNHQGMDKFGQPFAGEPTS